MEDIFNPKERIKKFKIDNKEEEYFKFPSPNYLERYGRLILDLMIGVWDNSRYFILK